MLTGRPFMCGSISSAARSYQPARSALVIPSSGNSTLSGRESSTLTTAAPSRRPLSHDVAGGLVVAQAEVARMAQAAVARPLREADLRDQLRAHPVRAARDRMYVRERRLVLLQVAELLAERRERAVVEAR